MTTPRTAVELLYSAWSRDWTIETGRTVHPDGRVTVESVTVESVVERIEAEAAEPYRKALDDLLIAFDAMEGVHGDAEYDDLTVVFEKAEAKARALLRREVGE